MTRVFHWLLTRSAFPYRDCDLARRMDVIFMQELKETYCHMDHVSGHQIFSANFMDT